MKRWNIWGGQVKNSISYICYCHSIIINTVSKGGCPADFHPRKSFLAWAVNPNSCRRCAIWCWIRPLFWQPFDGLFFNSFEKYPWSLAIFALHKKCWLMKASPCCFALDLVCMEMISEIVILSQGYAHSFLSFLLAWSKVMVWNFLVAEEDATIHNLQLRTQTVP